MPYDATLQRILDGGIVAIVRAPSGEMLAELGEALLAGGIACMEVTFTVPAAHRVLEQLRSRLDDRMVLGAGTILDTETARIALLSGAEFLVTPTLNVDVIRLCRRYSAPIMPGAMTPTEILAAWDAGADVVKVFPSEVLGPQYLRAIHGPLPQVRLMPTGGVNLQTAADFLRAGACALGLGTALVERQALQQRDWQRIESLARQYVQIVREVRGA
jgi:2-dehydro-3-deoxyphosphogluconate aldolase/(4S)-4-hydroxy-2-oxoglutarate aldolase